MGLNRQFLFGFLACLMIVGCAGAGFRYYGLSAVNYNDGMLLGPKPKDDIPFSACAPVGNDAYPCVVMFSKEFFALKQDYEDTKQRLKECQKSN